MPFPFKNVGNSCYLGTALHALLHCPQLTNYFLKNLEEEDTNKRKKNASAFVGAYKKLVDTYWSSSGPNADADVTFEEVRLMFLKHHGKTFKEGQQHDAHEALMCLLQMLHTGLSKTKKIEGSKTIGVLEGPRLRAWNDANANNYSILTEIFQLQTENRIQTPDNTYKSTTYEHMFDLGVPVCKDIRDGTKSSLETILDYVLEDGTKTSITRTQNITYMPLILIMHVKRFSNKNDKINDYVDYPIHFSWPDDGPSGYDLFGVILHHGTMDSGHYTCMVKHRDIWFICNDEHIEEIKNINHVMSTNAYVLLYKKVL